MSYLILNYRSISKNTLHFNISGSKSISQRALIINYLMDFKEEIINLSDSEDTKILQHCLLNNESNLNVYNSGTSLRFLIAFYALINKEVTIFGDKYLFQRPITLLINYLNTLGAKISKKDNKIIIKKGKLVGGVLDLQPMRTSQFISSLLLIAPYLRGGLKLSLPEKIHSQSYVQMTINMLLQSGISIKKNKNLILVDESKYSHPCIAIESDWSSASYLFLSFLFSELDYITISSFSPDSLQGDSDVVDLFSVFGIKTRLQGDVLHLNKQADPPLPIELKWEFDNNPDLLLTVIIACLGLGVKLFASGITTLKYKESNRIKSMKNELLKFDSILELVSDESIYFTPTDIIPTNKLIHIETYNDHRIALSFSPLALLGFQLKIDNFEVINKSYRNFFNDLRRFGVFINK